MSAFPVQLDLKQSDEFCNHIKDICANGAAKSVKLDKVEKMSLACLQVLVAAQKSGCALEIEPSDALTDIINDLGLTDFINLKRR